MCGTETEGAFKSTRKYLKNTMTAEGKVHWPLTRVHDDVDEVHALGECVPQVDVVEGDDAALAFCPIQCLPTFERLVSTHLVLIELGEIVNDDRNG